MDDDNTSGLAFVYEDLLTIDLSHLSENDAKRAKKEVTVARYHAVRDLQISRQPSVYKPHDGKFFSLENRKTFIAADVFDDRLKNEESRLKDFTFYKENGIDSRPFLTWDPEGDLKAIPGSLQAPVSEEYDDNLWFLKWKNAAFNRDGKPPGNFSPYARFLLKPSENLKSKKGFRVYFTPSEEHFFGIDADRLRTIIEANPEPINNWASWKVINVTQAKKLGLKLVGHHFLLLYYTWMKVDHYKQLWREFGADDLLHAFPPDGDVAPDVYGKIDRETLQKRKAKLPVNGEPITITSQKIRGAKQGGGRKTTKSVMGESATPIAIDLWGRNFIKTSFSKQSEAEWLHRSAFSYGGLSDKPDSSDDANNLVFGTWECNTDMIRVENVIKGITRGSSEGGDYRGTLRTTTMASGAVERFELGKKNTQATIPRWVDPKKYTWLCLALHYEYVMNPKECPLRETVAQCIQFDPWSLYVPLSVEPVLDDMIMKYLLTGGTSASVSNLSVAHPIMKRSLASDISNPLPSLLPPQYSSDAYTTLAWNAPIKDLSSIKLPEFTLESPTIAQVSRKGPPPIDPREFTLEPPTIVRVARKGPPPIDLRELTLDSPTSVHVASEGSPPIELPEFTLESPTIAQVSRKDPPPIDPREFTLAPPTIVRVAREGPPPIDLRELTLDSPTSVHVASEGSPPIELPEFTLESPTIAQVSRKGPPPIDPRDFTLNSPTIAQVASEGSSSIEPPEFSIESPTVAQVVSEGPPSIEPPDFAIEDETSVPQGGFVLQEKSLLFGTTVVGILETWMGPPPVGVVVGIEPPSINYVTVEGDFHMSTLIPLLKGTPFDNITFRNVSLYHQNYAFDKTKSIGWHFNADLFIDSSCGLLHDILTRALQVEEPVLSVHASFGERQSWNKPLNMHSFVLEGVFADLTISSVSGLTLTSIGVRLLGIRGFSLNPEPHSTLSYGFGVFGKMKLDVPGSVIPLDLDFEMGLYGKYVSLRAEVSGGIWKDALGVTGLQLADVVFATTLSATSPWKSFAFDVSATFSYLSSQAYLQGSYASGGQFALTAELDNFGTEEIHAIFAELFNDTVTLPDIDIHIGSAILSIASGQGVRVSLHDVNVAGHTALSVDVAFTTLGISLSGALSSHEVTFGDVQLRNASLELAFWSVGKKKNADIMLSGTLDVDFLDLAITAAVHLYPGQNGVEWAVVAELDAPGRPFAISDAVSGIKNTFLDFSLRNAVFIAASKDDPMISQPLPYVVRKGVQLFGVIDSIPALNQLLRQDVKGLVLNAGWSKTSGFNLMVSLPAEASLDLGNGVRTAPITLGIRTNPVELAVTTRLKVRVEDSTPLYFSFVLAANMTGASASAQMEGWWVKPFGIDNLKIGPEVRLSIEIIYSVFFTTGTPSGFGLAGGLKIGNIQARLAMNVSEDPRRQMLFGEVKKLDISDVVTLAGELVQQDIPKIADGLLKFEELKLYICPYGVVVGKTTYPQGFSFKADLLFFNKRANIECTIDKANKSIDIIGGVDNFELGPLSVRGLKGPRAELQCHIGASKQQLIIDGAISLFDMQAQTYINVQFLPEPIFKFHFLLEFASIFIFKLDAELLGSIHDRLSDADFSLHAELENDILDYISQHIIEQFEAAKQAATEGLEFAQKKVKEAQKDWEQSVSFAEKKVKDAEKEWKSYEQKIRSSSQPVIGNYLSEISRLEGEVDKARSKFDNAMRDAQSTLEEANRDRASKMAAAEHDVETARHNMNRDIDKAEQQLVWAKKDLENAFGDAQRDIDYAQRDVDRIEGEIDSTKGTIWEYEAASGWELWKKSAIPALWIEVGGLETAKGVATGFLEIARGVLKGSEFLSKEAGVNTARGALEFARATGQAALTTAVNTLQGADEATGFAVRQAKNVVEDVQTGVDSVAFEAAKGTLEQFKNLNKAAYEAAMQAIEGLMDSVAFVAFNTAKAGLEVARSSTHLLDLANDALLVAEKASQVALTTLETFVEYATHAVDIKKIVLSGTLRGIVGIGGAHSRPLSAVIQGYILGEWFDLRAEFDPREPVHFITAIFKQLWDKIPEGEDPTMMLAPAESEHGTGETAISVQMSQEIPSEELLGVVEHSGFKGLKSTFLIERPHVVDLLVDGSRTASGHIPRGSFSGNPMLPTLAVAKKALALMHEEREVSVFRDVHHRHELGLP